MNYIISIVITLFVLIISLCLLIASHFIKDEKWSKIFKTISLIFIAGCLIILLLLWLNYKTSFFF